MAESTYTVFLTTAEGKAVRVLAALRGVKVKVLLADAVRKEITAARKSGELKGA